MLTGHRNEQRANNGAHKSGGGGDKIFRFCGGGTVVGKENMFLTPVASAAIEFPRPTLPHNKLPFERLPGRSQNAILHKNQVAKSPSALQKERRGAKSPVKSHISRRHS